MSKIICGFAGIGNNSMNHCLFLTKTSGIGGAERQIMDLFRFIDYNKFSVKWAVRTDVFTDKIKSDNFISIQEI